MNNRQEQLVVLLERWAELSRQGSEVSATELCAGCPELLHDLGRHLHFLRGLEDLVVPEADPEETAFPEGMATPAPEDRALLTGTGVPVPVVPNHDVLGLLGEGGMGTVYRARDRRLGRVVALKMIRQGLAGPAQLARFQVEAEAVARLNHPHVVQVYEVGRWLPEQGGTELPYLALEYVEGDTLERRLGREQANPVDAARLLRLLARAVQAAHRAGIVHRDLKPANVLLGPPADEAALNCAWGWPKLTDFGLARRLECSGSLTQSGSVLGTPGYMAPEQADGRPDVGPAADVYGLGAVLYRLLTGRPPFRGENAVDTLHRVLNDTPVPPRQLRPAVPHALDALCRRCLEKDPARRPAVADLLEAMDRFLVGDLETTSLPAPAAVPAARRSGWTRRRVLAAGLAGLVPLAGWLTWALWPERGREAGGPEGVAAPPPDGAEAGPLKVRLLRVMHHERNPDGKSSTGRGALGERSFATRFADQVTVQVELSEPAYLYLLAFNADGREQLLWPADERNQPLPAAAPEKVARLLFPLGGKRYTLNDEPRGGLQVFVALASRRPLPPYGEWRGRSERGWGRREPGTAVWQADENGVYEVVPGRGADRGKVEAALGAPPLDRLCRALRGGGVEVVEAVAFPVRAGR